MSAENGNTRLEAFCDGVFAIALTLLIIDIKIPAGEIDTTRALWLALKHITPSIFAFVLSFIIILITWVNHHNTLKLVRKSTSGFIYANGFLLLTVVFVPFPTSLMGEFISTDHAAPAVMIYNSVLALQAIGWILICSIVLNHKLLKDEKSFRTINNNRRFGYFALSLYSACTIIAFWFPLTIALITTVSWIFWLAYGISIKNGGKS
jgi:uncharacterized membrane protein